MGGDGTFNGTFSGGAGGVTARHEDVLTCALLLDRMGDDFGEVAAALGRMVVNEDLMEAAVICPVEVAHAEGVLASATAGSGGAADAWLRAEGRARYLRAVVAAYREVDRVLAQAEQLTWQWGGFAVGAVALPAAAAVASNPWVDLALWTEREQLRQRASGLGETLYDEPWLQELVTMGGPGFIQGAVFGLSGGNLGIFNLVGGGRWPAGDFQNAVGGLIAFASLTGTLSDSGAFHVEKAAGPVGHADFRRERFAGSALTQQRELSTVASTVQVVSIEGGRAYVVQIPGTQEWNPRRKDNLMDTTSNLTMMAGEEAQLEKAVVDAMHAAGIAPHAPVMLTGHSQGGIVAASIAANTDFRHQFNIQAVLTAGSPIGRVPIPGDISVLSLEEREDLVPKLDGVANPDRPNWVTATRDLAQGAVPSPHHDLGAAHSLANYEQMAQVLDASNDPSISTWRDHNSAFFGAGSVQRFQIVKGPS